MTQKPYRVSCMPAAPGIQMIPFFAAEKVFLQEGNKLPELLPNSLSG